MTYDPKDLYSVLLFIKDEYGVEIFKSNKAVSILMDLAPELKRDSKVLQKLIDNKLIETLINLGDQDRENEIKRIEMILEDRELIHPEISDYCVRTVADVFNEQSEEKITENEEKTEPLLEEKERLRKKKYITTLQPISSEREQNASVKSQKSPMSFSGLIILVITLSIIAVISVYNSRIEQEKDNQVTGLVDIVDPTKEYSRYLGQDIYTVASEINSAESVEIDEYVGVNYHSNIGAEENFFINFFTADNGRTINDIYLSGYSEKPNDGSNILGVTTGMSKSEAEKILKDQGFEIEPYHGDLTADKDDYSIYISIEDHIVDRVSISNDSL